MSNYYSRRAERKAALAAEAEQELTKDSATAFLRSELSAAKRQLRESPQHLGNILSYAETVQDLLEWAIKCGVKRPERTQEQR